MTGHLGQTAGEIYELAPMIGFPEPILRSRSEVFQEQGDHLVLVQGIILALDAIEQGPVLGNKNYGKGGEQEQGQHRERDGYRCGGSEAGQHEKQSSEKRRQKGGSDDQQTDSEGGGERFSSQTLCFF